MLLLNILACLLQRLVTLGDYSLPARFISDCICFSRQCPSSIRFPLAPCLHARRGAEIRIDKSTERLVDQITGLPLSPPLPRSHLPNAPSHHSRIRPQLLTAAHRKRRTQKCGHCVRFAPTNPPRPCACDTTSATDSDTEAAPATNNTYPTGRRASPPIDARNLGFTLDQGPPCDGFKSQHRLFAIVSRTGQYDSNILRRTGRKLLGRVC